MNRETFALIIADSDLEPFTICVVEAAAAHARSRRRSLTGSRTILLPSLADITVIIPTMVPSPPEPSHIRVELQSLVAAEIETHQLWPEDLDAWTLATFPMAWQIPHRHQQELQRQRRMRAATISGSLAAAQTSLDELRQSLGLAIEETRRCGEANGLSRGRIDGLLHRVIGNLAVRQLRGIQIAALVHRLGISLDDDADVALDRIGHEVLRQAAGDGEAPSVNVGLGSESLSTVELGDRREIEELRPGCGLNMPRADADQLAEATLDSDTQRGHDLEKPVDSKRIPLEFDEWLKQSAELLEKNDRIFNRRADDDSTPF